VQLLYLVFTLQEAGFPFSGDDLPLPFWGDLARFRWQLKAKIDDGQ